MLRDYRKDIEKKMCLNQEESLMLLEFPKNRTID